MYYNPTSTGSHLSHFDLALFPTSTLGYKDRLGVKFTGFTLNYMKDINWYDVSFDLEEAMIENEGIGCEIFKKFEEKLFRKYVPSIKEKHLKDEKIELYDY